MPWRCLRLRRRPAVSTRMNVRPLCSSTVSVVSRVVPGTSCDDRALLAEQLVEERRLADVRPAEDRDADRVVVGHDAARDAGQAVEHLVEQVAGVRAVQRRDRERVAEAEAVQLERERRLRRVVDLVREQQHVLLRLAQDLRELLVARRDAGARVDDEQHEVGLGDRGARLLRDLARDRDAGRRCRRRRCRSAGSC